MPTLREHEQALVDQIRRPGRPLHHLCLAGEGWIIWSHIVENSKQVFFRNGDDAFCHVSVWDGAQGPLVIGKVFGGLSLTASAGWTSRGDNFPSFGNQPNKEEMKVIEIA
jgi:hypothetical protein